MEQIKLPYKEWFTIQEVADKLNCSVDDLIYWSRYYIDLYLNADSLYGKLSISCDRDAPAIASYIQYYKKVREHFKDPIDDYSFSTKDLIYLLPHENNRDIGKMRQRYSRGAYNPFFIDISTDVKFCAEMVYKGQGHWRVGRLDREVRLYSSTDEKLYEIRDLYLNLEYYLNYESKKEFIDGLDVSFHLYDKIFVSKNDFVIRVNDYIKLMKGDELEYKESNNNSIIGKPSHFYKKSAIDAACLTRKENPQSKVVDISRKIYFTIVNSFNSVNPPTKDTISNWLYEIKLGKPTVRSNDDFELVIPDEWIDYSE